MSLALPQPIRQAAVLLFAFSVLTTGLVVLVYHGTADRIAANQRQTLRQTLESLLPPQRYDNDLLADVIEVSHGDLDARGPVPVFRARKQGQPVAVVMAVSAAEGYSGEIRLLLAINDNASLAGVRVLAHKETPGLGDLIEENKSDWVLAFDGLSLDNPGEALWKVKRDGGVFDQFAGATVTPRAVVKTVRKTLAYFAAHHAKLFSEPAQAGIGAKLAQE